MNLSPKNQPNIPFNFFFPNKVKAVDNSAFLKALYHNKVDEKLRVSSNILYITILNRVCHH